MSPCFIRAYQPAILYNHLLYKPNYRDSRIRDSHTLWFPFPRDSLWHQLFIRLYKWRNNTTRETLL